MVPDLAIATAVADEARATARGVERLAGVLRLLLVACLVLPFLVIGTLAWINYRKVADEAETTVHRVVDVLYEHAERVLETQDLVLDKIDTLISGRDWNQIAHAPDIAAALMRAEHDRRPIAAIWLVDANGRVRAGASEWVAGTDVSARDFFRAASGGFGGTYVGRAERDRASGRESFAFSRARLGTDGQFDGVIAIAVAADFFSNFFRRAVPPGAHITALIRLDGEILAREPMPTDTAALPDARPLLEAIAARREGRLWLTSADDGVRRLYGFRKSDRYPVAVVFAMTREAALMPWFARLGAYLGLIGAASIALFFTTLLALRRAQSEAAALVRLGAEAQRRATVENELRQAQKMESLGQLTGNVAHDFNNLLAIMLSNLELVCGQPDDTRTRARLESALAAGLRGKDLVASLLSFARKQPLVVRPFDLRSVFADMEVLLRQAVGPTITLQVQLAPDLHPVKTDMGQTEMAILNLVVNARDAMPQGGVLRIEGRNVTLHGEHEGLVGEFVALAVADTGIGMPPDVLARAFEPFFTTKQPGKGTGLGLSAVFGFVKQSRGATTITSRPGDGTVVTIYLPRAIALAMRAQESCDAG
ncbi:MAG: hybrid sensor histidine kinase/response regulator [Alphaproteobacteria bacterium]|nr:hybrid sensor histidine kinase/response regulator [Alphaproteobacteria bacterium]